MADLINRDAFILSLKTRRAEAYLSELDDCDTEEEKCRINDEMYYSTQSFIDVMKCQPVVDAKPVVCCKDCIHNDDCMNDLCGYGRKDDDFCSYGERKT